jgi:hippurate hydrolase
MRPGALMASTDQFEITLTGRGGHAAAPHQAIDTNLAAAQVVVALQSIASRNVNPLDHVVVSVCTPRSDTEAFNVIPQTVLLRGTVRALSNQVRDLAQERLTKLTAATAEAYGCVAEIDYLRDYPVTVNDADSVAIAGDVAALVTPQVDRDTPPIMAGEDFSFMLEERPGAYVFLGVGDGPGLHHPKYDFNDAVIPVGCSWFAELVEQRMPAA